MGREMKKADGRKGYEKSPMDKGGAMKGAKPMKTMAKADNAKGGNVVNSRAKKFC